MFFLTKFSPSEISILPSQLHQSTSLINPLPPYQLHQQLSFTNYINNSLPSITTPQKLTYYPSSITPITLSQQSSPSLPITSITCLLSPILPPYQLHQQLVFSHLSSLLTNYINNLPSLTYPPSLPITSTTCLLSPILPPYQLHQQPTFSHLSSLLTNYINNLPSLTYPPSLPINNLPALTYPPSLPFTSTTCFLSPILPHYQLHQQPTFSHLFFLLTNYID